MIEINNVKIYNIQNAIYSMRNPLESWSRSDSIDDNNLGVNDLILAQKLILSGENHSKFMRQIFVSMDIEAPLYWWKEMDQYRIGCTTNSESTMHKLAVTPITRNCFSFDDELESLEDIKQYVDEEGSYLTFSETIIRNCNTLRLKYLETKDNRYWRALIQLLPSSWNQKRTWTANYAVLRSIYFSRKTHKLQEWKDFCKEIEKLPYAKELICIEKEKT